MIAPVLVIAFNRPDLLPPLFDKITAAQPSAVYIAVDGPRSGREQEREAVAKVRKLAESHNFGTSKHLLFQDSNLGCRHGVAAAIKWFFGEVPEGIVLEDDIDPVPEFFQFCNELLEAYRDHLTVWSISGTNALGHAELDGDFFGTTLFEMWGWASWANRWVDYSADLDEWPAIRAELLQGVSWRRRLQLMQLIHQVDATVFDGLDTWDYQRIAQQYHNKGLTLFPRRSLVSNRGAVEGVRAGTPLWYEPSGLWRPKFPMRIPAIINCDPRLQQQMEEVRYGMARSNWLRRQIKTALPTALVDAVRKARGFANPPPPGCPP